MITIKHNFDPSKFMWLWAKYVSAGNIEKHCTACLIGPYSKKFSGATNKDMLSHPVLTMDEVPESSYQAIYFCGVLKKGYLNKNPEKNNYRHNVHFAVVPRDGVSDVWDFEEWHVEIEGGKLERIPATYELAEEFFKAPYDAHYYTCRIFRWMVGHFYPEKLIDIYHGWPKEMADGNYDGGFIDSKSIIQEIITRGYDLAKVCFEEASPQEEQSLGCHYWSRMCDLYFGGDYNVEPSKLRKHVLSNNLFNRKEFSEFGPRLWNPLKQDNIDSYLADDDNERYFNLGVEEYLDTLFPYQERKIMTEWSIEQSQKFYHIPAKCILDKENEREFKPFQKVNFDNCYIENRTLAYGLAFDKTGKCKEEFKKQFKSYNGYIDFLLTLPSFEDEFRKHNYMLSKKDAVNLWGQEKAKAIFSLKNYGFSPNLEIYRSFLVDTTKYRHYQIDLDNIHIAFSIGGEINPEYTSDRKNFKILWNFHLGDQRDYSFCMATALDELGVLPKLSDSECEEYDDLESCPNWKSYMRFIYHDYYEESETEDDYMNKVIQLLSDHNYLKLYSIKPEPYHINWEHFLNEKGYMGIGVLNTDFINDEEMLNLILKILN